MVLWETRTSWCLATLPEKAGECFPFLRALLMVPFPFLVQPIICTQLSETSKDDENLLLTGNRGSHSSDIKEGCDDEEELSRGTQTWEISKTF